MERFKAAKCPIHGADNYGGKGCEVFHDRNASINIKKRHNKRSRQAAKRIIKDD